jgi:hypothetical protein
MSSKTQLRPRSGKIPQAVEYSGIGRSTLYELAPQFPGLFKKNGAATLVDFDILDVIIDQLPLAEITPPKHDVEVE